MFTVSPHRIDAWQLTGFVHTVVRSSRVLALPLTVLLLTLFLPMHARATSVRDVSVRELVDEAELVVVARTIDRTSYWEEGRILTRSRLAIENVWKSPANFTDTSGAPPKELNVVTMGGVVDNIGQRVDGVEQLEVNERVVLLLRRDVKGAWRTVSLARGAFHIAKEPDTLNPRIFRQNNGLDIVKQFPGSNVAEPTTLSELKRTVEEAIHGR